MTVPGCHLHILSMVNLYRCLLTCLVVFIPMLLHKIQLLRCRIYRPESTGDCCRRRKRKNARLIGIADTWSLQWALRFFSAPNLRLKLPKKLQDRYIGPFRVISRVGPTAYHLDLSTSSALKHLHPTFHISLLREFRDNGLYQQPPPVEIDGDDEWEIERILGHRLFRG